MVGNPTLMESDTLLIVREVVSLIDDSGSNILEAGAAIGYLELC
jgi:hypothetical protein